jgi:molybdopterin molybdotransferase
MSRRADDCLSAPGRRMAVTEALRLLRERAAPMVGPETVPLDAAAGRVLAAPWIAPRDVPAFDNVAVDGYAFAWAAALAEGGATLRLVPGRAAAGHPHAASVPPGACLRVLTGAPLPAGTDTVALQEAVRIEGDRVVLPPGLRRGANRRRAGEDIRAGQEAVAAGTRLLPQHIGVAAGLGLAAVEVFLPLRVALLSTGDEIVEPGAALPEGGVYDANRHVLKALLDRLPVRVADLGIVRDEACAVQEALEAAARDHHVVLTSGGASRGDEDHVVRSVARHGRLEFWQIAMKPGRPLAFGQLREAIFLGLPGNPVAAMVCFLLFARPLLLRLAGAIWPEPRRWPVRAAFAMQKQPGRTELLRARLEPEPSGGWRALRIPRQGSGVLTTMTEADGLVELDPAREEVREGELVPFLSFAELGLLP